MIHSNAPQCIPSQPEDNAHQLNSADTDTDQLDSVDVGDFKDESNADGDSSGSEFCEYSPKTVQVGKESVDTDNSLINPQVPGIILPPTHNGPRKGTLNIKQYALVSAGTGYFPAVVS